VKITPSDYKNAGKRVCQTHVDSILKEYPDAEEDHFEYLCLDLAYIYALLTKGYGLKDKEPLYLVDKIDYKGQPVEAAWALGDAIAVMNAFLVE
jgi:apyrase